MANELDFSTGIGLIKGLAGKPDPADIATAVDTWLDDHPEATTTVQDGSITEAKLDSNLQGTVADVTALKSAVEDLEAGSLSAVGASEGQVPVADGAGSWEWDDAPGGVSDVQINGESVVSQGVANVPVASGNDFGVVKIGSGMSINENGILRPNWASELGIKEGTSSSSVLLPYRQHMSTFYGLAKAAGDSTQSASSNTVGEYTEAAKSAISTMLNGAVAVTGTTPSITANPGIRYVCGEVSTLDITLPASGIVDVVFESGSTPTVLTITPPTGVTIKWAGGFDPTALEANATYEINVCDGLGVACEWT